MFPRLHRNALRTISFCLLTNYHKTTKKITSSLRKQICGKYFPSYLTHPKFVLRFNYQFLFMFNELDGNFFIMLQLLAASYNEIMFVLSQSALVSFFSFKFFFLGGGLWTLLTLQQISNGCEFLGFFTL